MNRIVKYDNYMNNLRFKGFTSIDFNFLMALCSRMRDNGTNTLKFSFSELKQITGYACTSLQRFVNDVLRMNDKLMGMKCVLEKDGEIFQFVLFPTFSLNINEEILSVSVNEKFIFILNDITKNFTRFELEQFIKIESKHAKNLYRILKQYRTTGKFEVSISAFREKMDCPESYTNKHVMDKIIKPSLKELKEKGYFHNLQCETKYARKPGKPVSGYLFTFSPDVVTGRLDHPEPTQDRKGKIRPEKSGKSKTAFHNFPQREYNYDELESELLNNSRYDSKDSENLIAELEAKLQDEKLTPQARRGIESQIKLLKG